MTASNKKIAITLGAALLVGAAGFFTYSFFKKPPVDSVDDQLNMETKPQQESKNNYWGDFFSKAKNDFSELVQPVSQSGFNSKLWNTIK